VAIELIAYAAPLADGVGLVTPRDALEGIGAASRLLGGRQQATQLSLLVPRGWTVLGDRDVRGFYRRAATSAIVARAHVPDAERGPRGRWHTALVVCGWLLIVGGGGSTAAGLAGLWLGVLYPLLRGSARRRRREASQRAAAGLAHAVADAPIVAREHEGLTSLGAIVNDASRTPSDRYRHAAAACGSVGLDGLAELYEALARGATPDVPWSVDVMGASETTNASGATDATAVELPTQLSMEGGDGPLRQSA
jgi:hypothetical protein